jgi:hypothetical protein
MGKIKWSILAGMIILCAFPATAQKKSLQPAKTGQKTGLIPVFSSSLGHASKDTVPVTLMKQLLDSSLVARDSSGQPHPVVSFNFGYRTSDTFLNDSTGRPETSNLYTTFHFKSDKLDSLWRTAIGGKIKPGDELFFDRIIARTKQGVQYLSSPLHFKVK